MEKVKNKNKSNRQSIMTERCSIIKKRKKERKKESKKERKKDISEQIEIEKKKWIIHLKTIL